jgi:RNA polymerase sigma-70 factor (sigma-E family)
VKRARAPAPNDASEPDFDGYVRASGPRLRRLAFLLTGDVDLAEDLLQSAYARALPHWSRVHREGNPDAYLRQTMVNLRTSWWRRQRVALRPGREPAPGLLGTGGEPDPADKVGEYQVLLAALRTLPQRQRVAVVLRHYCDLTEAQTAQTMGISVGAVKSYTSRGLAALRLVVPHPVTGATTSRNLTASRSTLR